MGFYATPSFRVTVSGLPPPRCNGLWSLWSMSLPLHSCMMHVIKNEGIRTSEIHIQAPGSDSSSVQIIATQSTCLNSNYFKIYFRVYVIWLATREIYGYLRAFLRLVNCETPYLSRWVFSATDNY